MRYCSVATLISTSLISLAGLTLAVGCGEDDDGDDSSSDICEEGCAAVMAAACANSPPSQANCESTCVSLLRESCGAEYDEYQSCAVGKAVTCDASGRPTVEACSAEQDAFLACMNP